MTDTRALECCLRITASHVRVYFLWFACLGAPLVLCYPLIEMLSINPARLLAETVGYDIRAQTSCQVNICCAAMHYCIIDRCKLLQLCPIGTAPTVHQG